MLQDHIIGCLKKYGVDGRFALNQKYPFVIYNKNGMTQYQKDVIPSGEINSGLKRPEGSYPKLHKVHKLKPKMGITADNCYKTL